MKSDAALGAGDAILIQGDFVPYQGANFRSFQHVGTISASNDWAPFHINTLSLAEALITFTVSVQTGATEFSGRIFVRHMKAGQQNVTDTLAGSVAKGDIIDNDLAISKAWSLFGIVAIIPFDTQNLDVATLEEKYMPDISFPIPDLDNGDYLSYDVRMDSGSLSGVVDLSMVINGIVKQKLYSKAGDFLRGSNIVLPGENESGGQQK